MKNAQREAFDVGALCVLGLAVRIFAPLSASFPLNDGGLFYQMTIDLQKNHFLIPSVTTYNSAGLPFVYPPLAFYLYGFVNQASGISLLRLMQFTPAIISSLTIPVFYLLAKQLLADKKTAVFATLGYAFVPRGFDWLIMGGGMTRSLGFLFAILSIYQASRLFSEPSNINLGLTALFSGLTALTHPEASVHTFVAILFLYFWKDRSIKGAIRIALFGAGAIFISAPWWSHALKLHGIAPFYAALTSASGDSPSLTGRILSLFIFQLTDEPFLQFNAVIGLVGFFALVAQRKPGLFLWLMAIILIEPRGGVLYAMLPLNLAFGVGIEQIGLTLRGLSHKPASNGIDRGFIIFVLVYGLLNASFAASSIRSQRTLTEEDLRAFEWVKTNTAKQSPFALITLANPFNDAASEWFPALTQRMSLATVFGYEWRDDIKIVSRVEAYNALQACAFEGASCLQQWAAGKQQPDYIYIRQTNARLFLIEQLKSTVNYEVVYETESIVIFQRHE